MTPADRAEVLLAIRQVASSLSSMRGSSHVQGGSNYWNAGYHLNIRLYERLLFGVFDILDEGQLIEVSISAIIINIGSITVAGFLVFSTTDA